MLGNALADPGQHCVADDLDRRCLEQRINEVLHDLDIRERRVLRMRYGLQGEQVFSVRDIAKLLRLSKERIRQIEQGALEKLRRPEQVSRLVHFLPKLPDLTTSTAELRKYHNSRPSKAGLSRVANKTTNREGSHPY